MFGRRARVFLRQCARRISLCPPVERVRAPASRGERKPRYGGIMAVAAGTFDAWLSKKLQALNTDEGVFGTYIRGILEGDETEDEKTEALESILVGITVRERDR